jgi:hypothetical protein
VSESKREPIGAIRPRYHIILSRRTFLVDIIGFKNFKNRKPEQYDLVIEDKFLKLPSYEISFLISATKQHRENQRLTNKVINKD